jgi:hypothetical protein
MQISSSTLSSLGLAFFTLNQPRINLFGMATEVTAQF